MKRKGLGLGKGKGYLNILMTDSAVHSLSARGICQKSALVEVPVSRNVVYHSGVHQNIYDKDHPEKLSKKEKTKLCNEIDNLKSEIAFLIDDVKEHKGMTLKGKQPPQFNGPFLADVLERHAQNVSFLRAQSAHFVVED